ncbi:hypothetical protein [Leptospira borgpetersenii]|uniref:Uncharacterized protein n=3 Tax=Leptospira borgpetersenii TaxID=174 RepID=M3HJN5_LEPBO|nr:hypothetical protein [Leptospira borgpetersenii]EKP13204.1 hypothetical protein LEP1GSC128_3951 [Leptospira borgpetersenii str. 200801926]EMF98315.1 hypothetical protein LEP1GSC123_1720 [Leptospira borgpetersenii str. 200701203]ENO64724.1 hypothetical protein LEP1GSC191_1660 [Leptospira borgpetersenii serovar Mini str. 201000851]EMN11299.1 hypothetical protein LEP1GSC055_0063 [Leptospira borgpetersenii str. Brem 307]EMN16929.1 hypothetical protein LEP1GSC056_2403 [Leptospira borgpetersenii 
MWVIKFNRTPPLDRRSKGPRSSATSPNGSGHFVTAFCVAPIAGVGLAGF